ncbi:LexA family protein [Mesorhizobium amorphae]|uniref:LexA family protein n=1 Tax=Mesorhizobium amorphae TaxID=71433 RepID=UPI00164235AA|nr:helix-turn-helix domain-containing protein [Mesorhizobium amorphae]
MTALTPKMAKCLKFIGAYALEHGYSPNLQEIAAHMGLAGRSSAIRIVDELQERGLVRRLPKFARNIEIIEQQGADFHLKRILDAVSVTGFIGLTDPIISEAQAYAGRAA